MKKRNMKRVAVAGLMSGLLVVSQANAAESNEVNQALPKLASTGCGNHKAGGCNAHNRSAGEIADNSDLQSNSSSTLTSDQLKSQLNEKSRALYDSLDDEGKALAIKLAAGTCKGKNDCRGLSGCKTAANDCKGKNGCKGTGTAKFTDKNDAVKIAAQKMAEKRGSSANSKY